MLLIFAVELEGEASNDALLSWFHSVRRAAMEIPGIFDLALYGKGMSYESHYWCTLDIEDEQSLASFLNDPAIKDALRRGENFGVRLVKKSISNRLL